MLTVIIITGTCVRHDSIKVENFNNESHIYQNIFTLYKSSD